MTPTPPGTGGPAHLLHGLRCIWCQTLDTSWLWTDTSTVECAECGQTSLTTPDMTGEGA
jgi:Zn ribbon nucleic-acid-binding protein